MGGNDAWCRVVDWLFIFALGWAAWSDTVADEFCKQLDITRAELRWMPREEVRDHARKFGMERSVRNISRFSYFLAAYMIALILGYYFGVI